MCWRILYEGSRLVPKIDIFHSDITNLDSGQAYIETVRYARHAYQSFVDPSAIFDFREKISVIAGNKWTQIIPKGYVQALLEACIAIFGC